MHYKLPVLGFRIEKFAYITDAKTIEEDEKEKLKRFRFINCKCAKAKETFISF
jgi:phosphoribosyl 1,2-cyclic phosphate phosphodiesterase